MSKIIYYNNLTMSQIKRIISPAQVKEFQQTGKYLQCEYNYQWNKHISFHCQFIDTWQYYNLYDFRNVYDPKWTYWNVCIFSIPKNSSAWAFKLPTHVYSLWLYSNAEAITSPSIRSSLFLPPSQTSTMSKLQTLMIDSYLKDKKNLKRITDFTIQLKNKSNTLRARRDELHRQKNDILDELDENDNLFKKLEEAIEDWDIATIEEILSKNISPVLPLK